MRRHTLSTFVVTSSLLVLTALPAFGHARLEQSQVPAASAQELSMRVPGEREGTTSDAVEIQVPAEFTDVACATVAGWTCETAESANGTVLDWERQDDGDPETPLVFTATTPTEPGTYRLPTVQIYSDGSEVAWIQSEDGAERPAPSLTVAEQDASVEQATGTPDDHAEPAPSGSTTESAAAEEPTPAAEATDAEVAPTPADDAQVESEVETETETGAETEIGNESPFLPVILAFVAVGGVVAVLVRRRRARS